MRAVTTLLIAAVALVAVPAAAEAPDDAAALRGVERARVVWDITTADAERLGLFLEVVRETYDDLVRQEVEPRFVLAIHGAPVKYVTEDRDALALETQFAADKLNAVLDDLAGRAGVRVEVCAVANRLLGVDNASFRDGIHVVGNTWVSLIGYQAQGYVMVPVH